MVYITIGSVEESQTIGATLVKKRLAICVNHHRRYDQNLSMKSLN